MLPLAAVAQPKGGLWGGMLLGGVRPWGDKLGGIHNRSMGGLPNHVTEPLSPTSHFFNYK